MTKKSKIIIDSGAFSAWKLNKSVDFCDYCQFLLDNRDWIDHYVNLDVILPGDPERAAKEGMDNYVKMRALGLDPIPVLHIGEDMRWLDMMLDLGADYIGFSATSIAARQDVDRWYDLAWQRICDSSGNPIVKVHAFGDGREQAMHQFPWRSADTATWLTGQQHGRVYMPDGQMFSHTQKRVHSKTSPDIDMLEGEDAEEFDRIVKNIGLDKSALTERQGKRSFAARTHFAAMYYKQVEERVKAAQPIKYCPRQGLITSFSPRKEQGREIKDFDMYLVIGPNSLLLPALYSIDHNKILLSYFYAHKRMTQSIKEYAQDPLTCLANHKPYANYLNILREILPDAKF